MESQERPAESLARSSSSPRTSAVALLVAATLACFGSVYKLGNYPRYTDFDSATLGIFINDLSYHGRFDYSFVFPNRAEEYSGQEDYRRHWAAAALPLTLPLSWVQRALRIHPRNVGLLIRGAAALFGLLGSFIAVWGLCRRESWGGSAFAFAVTSVFPPLLLNIRTGFPAHVLAFLLFWTALALALTYGRTRRTSLLFALGVTVALCVLNPYPPLLALPFLVLGLLLWRPGLRSLVQTPSCYAAAGLAAGLYLGAQAALARLVGLPLRMYRQTVSAFIGWRSGFSLFNVSLPNIPGRLRLVWDQLVLFRSQGGAERTGRSDEVWTLGSVDVAWLLILALAVGGAFVALRWRRENGLVALCVLFATIIVLTIHGPPEGRYAMVVAPCIGMLAGCALRALPLSRVARQLLMAAVILVASLNTFGLVLRNYSVRQDHSWPQVDGIEELARLSPGRWEGGLSYVSFPFAKTNEANLYLRMVTSNNARWVSKEDLERRLQDNSATRRSARFFVVVRAANLEELAAWERRDFRVLSRFDAASGDGPLVLLMRVPHG